VPPNALQFVTSQRITQKKQKNYHWNANPKYFEGAQENSNLNIRPSKSSLK